MKSIRSKVYQFAIVAFIAIAAVGSLTALTFVHIKQKTLSLQTAEYLNKSMEQQAGSILLAYLLPEQQGGVDLLLEEIGRNESLSRILLFESAPPAEFVECAEKSVCQSVDGSETAVIRPIKDGPKTYAYLLKAKTNHNKEFEELMYLGIFVITISISLLIGLLLFFFGIFIQRDISDSLTRLLASLRDCLSGNTSTLVPNAKYREFSDLEQSIAVLLHDHKENQQLALVAKMASQVAHDIRSPLTALQMATLGESELTEERRILVRNATHRIRDIANDLISKYKGRASVPASVGLESHLIPTLVESLISEKRLLTQENHKATVDLVLEPSAYSAFAKVEPASLKRALSNLLNNAIEAIEGNGRVDVVIRCRNSRVEVAISDNGRGMPPEVLKRLGERDFTLGKEAASGTGLGVHYAKTVADQLGGVLTFESQLGTGTTVTLGLPQCETPVWFIQEIVLSVHRPIVVVDDDESIHNLWESRIRGLFSHSTAEPEIIHFSSLGGFAEWMESKTEAYRKNCVSFVDFEFLNSKETGLDVLERLSLKEQAYLVTSRFEEADVPSRCIELGLKLLPKAMAIYVPLRLALSVESAKAVQESTA